MGETLQLPREDHNKTISWYYMVRFSFCEFGGMNIYAFKIRKAFYIACELRFWNFGQKGFVNLVMSVTGEVFVLLIKKILPFG